MKTKQLSKKLDFKKLGVFKIKWQIRSVNFKLQLLKIISVYSVFHALLLELVLVNASLARIMNVEGYEDQDYHIKKVLNQG